MPYFLIDGQSGYQKLNAPRFHLLIFSDGQRSYTDLESSVAINYNNLMDVNVVPLYPPIANVFGTSASFMVLLRPTLG